MLSALNNIRIVLVEPSHPGNIGAVARAMKTMGLSHLCLVNPKKFPHYEASKLAAGAESVLLNAEVVPTVGEAVADCSLILGTSVRDREVAWPTSDPRQSAHRALSHLSDQADHSVAILFGRESSGLNNAEMDLCRAQIRIDANDEYSSLNLANAVQIICYELRMNCLSRAVSNHEANTSTSAQSATSESSSAHSAVDRSIDIQAMNTTKPRQRLATQAEREGHLEHLQKTLETLDFSKSKTPTVLMRKLTRLYNKAELTVEEIQILRGVLSSFSDKVRRMRES